MIEKSMLPGLFPPTVQQIEAFDLIHIKILPWLACEGSETLTDSCPVNELTPIMPVWPEPGSWVCPRGTL